MKHRSATIAIIALLPFLLSFYSPAFAVDDPGFIIKRMVMSENIIAKEPVTISETFSTVTEKTYCFLEAVQIEQDTSISFVWYFEDKEMARISLPLKKGPRWRTYSSKKLAGLKGDWKVELQDSFGIVLHSVSFRVQ